MDTKYIAACQKLESLGYEWKYDEWTMPTVYGCHCELMDGQKPDGCVIDSGDIRDCIWAERLSSRGESKESCKYWQPIVWRN